MRTASIKPTIDLPVTTHTNSPNIRTTESKMNTSVITNSHRQIRRDCLVVSCGVNGALHGSMLLLLSDKISLKT